MDSSTEFLICELDIADLLVLLWGWWGSCGVSSLRPSRSSHEVVLGNPCGHERLGSSSKPHTQPPLSPSVSESWSSFTQVCLNCHLLVFISTCCPTVSVPCSISTLSPEPSASLRSCQLSSFFITRPSFTSLVSSRVARKGEIIPD